MLRDLDIPTYANLLEVDKLFDMEMEEQLEEEKRDMVEILKVEGKDRFELPQIKYPEDK